MREENKIRLSDMQNRLQAIMHYDNPESAMKTLLYGFEKWSKRVGWARNTRFNGFMSPSVAREFANYVGLPIHKN